MASYTTIGGPSNIVDTGGWDDDDEEMPGTPSRGTVAPSRPREDNSLLPTASTGIHRRPRDAGAVSGGAAASSGPTYESLDFDPFESQVQLEDAQRRCVGCDDRSCLRQLVTCRRALLAVRG
jgi:hypothetical protein